MDTLFIDCYKRYVKNRRNFFSVITVTSIFFAFMFSALPQGASSQANQNPSSNKREDAYRANNLGVALLEQFNPKQAVEKFRKALEIDPQLSIAHVNLSSAFLRY